MMDRDLDAMNCLKEGWQSFSANPGLAIGGFFIYGFMAAIGQMIPIFGVLFAFLVSPVLLGGFILLTMNLAGRAEPKLDDLFQGFQQFGRLLGVYWLMSLAAIVGMIPSFAVMFAYFGAAMEGADPGPLFLFVFLLNMMVVAVFFLRWSMVFFIVMDEPHLGVIDCFRRSEQITSGNRMNLVILGILSFLVAIVGLLAFLIGYIVAIPVTSLAFARAYFWLRSFHPPVVAVTQPQVDPGPVLQ